VSVSISLGACTRFSRAAAEVSVAKASGGSSVSKPIIRHCAPSKRKLMRARRAPLGELEEEIDARGLAAGAAEEPGVDHRRHLLEVAQARVHVLDWATKVSSWTISWKRVEAWS